MLLVPVVVLEPFDQPCPPELPVVEDCPAWLSSEELPWDMPAPEDVPLWLPELPCEYPAPDPWSDALPLDDPPLD